MRTVFAVLSLLLASQAFAEKLVKSLFFPARVAYEYWKVNEKGACGLDGVSPVRVKSDVSMSVRHGIAGGLLTILGDQLATYADLKNIKVHFASRIQVPDPENLNTAIWHVDVFVWDAEGRLLGEQMFSQHASETGIVRNSGVTLRFRTVAGACADNIKITIPINSLVINF